MNSRATLRSRLEPIQGLIHASTTYLVCNALTRSVPFLILPVLTRHLAPADLGKIAMYSVALAFVTPLAGLATEGAIGRQFVERDEIDYPKYVANCMYIAAASSIALTLILSSFSNVAAGIFALPALWISTVPLLAGVKYVYNSAMTIWQMDSRRKLYVIMTVLQMVFNVGVSMYLIIGCQMGWQGRVLGELAGYSVAGALSLFILTRSRLLGRGFNANYVRSALKFGGGLVPHLYGSMLIGVTDRLFLTHMVGLAETGVYLVGVQIAMLIGVLEHSFNQAWCPWLFAKLKGGTPQDRVMIKRAIYSYNVIIIALAVALSAVSPAIVDHLFGPGYAGAQVFVFWAALGYSFGGMYKMVANQIFFASKTHLLSVMTMITGIANIFLNYYLIKVNGSVGAAQATAASLFLSYVLTAMLSARVMRGLDEKQRSLDYVD